MVVPAGIAEDLPSRVDALINTGAGSHQFSRPVDDAGFLRRVTLDFAGRIPTTGELRAFLADPSPDKRVKVIDRFINGPEYPVRMAELFHVMLMERLGDRPEWMAYLRRSFETNRPWDRMVQDMLRGRSDGDDSRGATFFLSKRLENYGQNPVDYPALTRDVGRLFLGKDYQCAECHNHLTVKEYKQSDYQGLFAFFRNVRLKNADDMTVGELATTEKTSFASVFTKTGKTTGPRVPGMPEVAIPMFKQGEEYVTPPDPKTKVGGVPKFSTLEALAADVPAEDNQAFARNIVNRLWFIMMGRGLVHPLDLHHADNPPSHPELLDLLATEFVAHDHDIKWMLRQLARTQTYQRSSVLPEGVEDQPAELFLTANEKRLSAEQLARSVLKATGNTALGSGDRPSPDHVKSKQATKMVSPTTNAKARNEVGDPFQARFVTAFANAPREPETEFAPSLKAALFVLNDYTIIDLFEPRPGNLVDRLLRLEAPREVAEELYLSVLSRHPTQEEYTEVAAYVGKHTDRPAALGRLAWALLASTEFCVNH